MEAILFQVVGVLVFVLATYVSGKLIRTNANKLFAKKAIRAVHFCYWFFLVLPLSIEVVYPGFTNLDTALAITSISGKIPVIIGTVLCLIGSYYCVASSKLLAQFGRGAIAFKFSKRVAVSGVYRHVRNPMALGYYLLLLGVGLVSHSTYLIVFNLLIVIPAHIFYIKYFEEFEVAMRLGESYIQYKRQTPFLIPKFTICVKCIQMF